MDDSITVVIQRTHTGRVEAVHDPERRSHSPNHTVVEQMFHAEQGQALLESILEATDCAVFVLDGGRPPRILEASEGVRRLFDYDREQCLNRPFAMLHRSRAAHDSFQETMRAALEATGCLKRFEFPMRKAGGEVFPAEHTTLPLRDPRGERIGLISIVHDISAVKEAERRRMDLECRVQESQKLKNLGLTAGGVAHDFKNLITAIQGNAALIRGELDDHEDALRYADDILRASEQASELVQRLLSFSSRARQNRENVCLNRSTDEVLRALDAMFSEKIVFHLDMHDKLPEIAADAAQIKQVIMNLVLNAHQAIGEGEGRISIRTDVLQQNPSIHAGAVPLEKSDSASYVTLEVTDNGCGMDLDTRERVFEPFFTTKEQGSGLGLAATHGIVQQHQGEIVVESTRGRGTVVRVLLPAAEADAGQTMKDI